MKKNKTRLFSTFAFMCVLLISTSQANAIVNSVDTVSSLPISNSVVQLRGCTGVLVSSNWILTIAHCVDRYSDRTIQGNRDVFINTNRPRATFSMSGESVSVDIDRVVRVDGRRTLTNSLALMHLIEAAPDWSSPVPLYRGGSLPDDEERLEIFGFGSGSKEGGHVNILRKEWRDIDKFWVLRLNADPSRIEPGDSGGPVFINRNDRKEVIGINWNSGGASGGSVAATFNITDDGHSNQISCLIDSVINNTDHILTNGVYEISAMHSNKCLDVRRSSAADEADIIQYRCSNTTNQRWRLDEGPNGYYEIRAVHSDKCLDVRRSSMADEADIIQYECGNTTNQRWRFEEGPAGFYEMIAMHSCKCLDVARSSLSDEADIIQYTCGNTTNQRWRLRYIRP